MIEARLRELVLAALSRSTLEVDAGTPDVTFERPRQKEHGDFSTNLAMAIAGRLGRPPREVAQAIADAFPEDPIVSGIEVAGPGFLNFHVTHGWLYDVLRQVLAEGQSFGRSESLGTSVQVEFVSANPTGPLHVGTARNAVLGDALGRLLEAAGWDVSREYYFNDAGRQMDLFAASVAARYLQALGREAGVPEEGYHGAYLADIGRDIASAEGDSLADLPDGTRQERLLQEGSHRVLEGIKETLQRMGITFDSYFSERTLHETGSIAATVERLRAADQAYEAEGAVFFRASNYGDEKDRVLIKQNGDPTYFAADCAYLLDKFSRGFDHLIYVWGADHHGTVKRLEGAAEALGYDAGRVEVVLYQLVNLLRAGEPVRMSKRTGEIITLDELLDEVGPDAARFTLLAQSSDSAINFDIEEVKRQSLDNPVYYVQYAHARIASILRTAAERGVTLIPVAQADLELLTEEAEVDLLREIAEFPEQIQVAAELRAPHRLTHHVRLLAERFHRFYTDCRVIGEDADLTAARLWLAAGTKQVIANTLGILGVSAPESMEQRADD